MRYPNFLRPEKIWPANTTENPTTLTHELMAYPGPEEPILVASETSISLNQLQYHHHKGFNPAHHMQAMQSLPSADASSRVGTIRLKDISYRIYNSVKLLRIGEYGDHNFNPASATFCASLLLKDSQTPSAR